MKTGYYLSDK